MKHRFAIAAAAAATLMVLTGCSGNSGPGSSGSAGGDTGPFTIGISNGFVDSEYRTQMVADMQSTFDELKKSGAVDDLVVQSANVDVNGQIQQIRTLINKGVDAIIVDPNSATALNSVLEQATKQGIKVYAIDQAVTAPTVINVGIDQGEWAAKSAEWLADKVGDGASIAAVNGIAGNPADTARWAAAKGVFEKAGVKVVTNTYGGWDQTKAQQVTTNLLATYPKLQGIWTQDGMAQGVLKAVAAAGKTKSVVVSGEARVGFMRAWNEDMADGFSSIGVINPPGTGTTALRLAVAELQGKKLDKSKLTDGHSIVLPLDESITNDNFKQSWDKVSSKSDAYVLDSVLSASAAEAYLAN